MKQLFEDVWIADGDTVSFYTLPYTTRMTLVRLADGTLWVHSPIRLNAGLRRRVEALGEVRYLVAPNHLHHLYLQDWQRAYPDARLFGTREVITKRGELAFDGRLDAGASYPWSDELRHLLFTGSRLMEECVFLHVATRTLIVADLVENFAPRAFGPLQRGVARMTGILAPNGGMPRDWRLSFAFHKAEARAHLRSLLAWRPETIVMAHGEIVDTDAQAFLRRSFGWLKP
ncbi:DUF4336 domain-containing protein [Halomonas maura]|uniref:DUF4336 domain-containing protein n=1 Tax=Halomonas maura TaxID=117606 RepID=UPI0025B39A07|nr:DUF4336 domain-containing protein [Halomonas maura]MDN3556724.1 DUF4336 domain-containing protein [Halomonas maura]